MRRIFTDTSRFLSGSTESMVAVASSGSAPVVARAAAGAAGSG
jgi:hypothetical protein